MGQRNAILLLVSTLDASHSKDAQYCCFVHHGTDDTQLYTGFSDPSLRLKLCQVCKRGVWFYAGVASAGSPPPGTLQTRLI